MSLWLYISLCNLCSGVSMDRALTCNNFSLNSYALRNANKLSWSNFSPIAHGFTQKGPYLSRQRTPHKVCTEQPLHAKWTFEKKKTFDPSIDWAFLQSALQGVLSWLPGNRDSFSGINSCHSKCLWMCHLIQSWFPA